MKPIIAIPAIISIVYRAWSHKSLTPAGLVVATLTACIHALHPWSLPFALLGVFFLAGTRVTKIKHDVKAKLLMQASGNAGGEGARTHIQVLANSGVATVLIALHTYQLYRRNQPSYDSNEDCYSWPGDLLVVGIIANYAAVAADTFSSELGILSKSRPRLITSWNLRQVPPGTNGGVTAYGLGAGLLGSLIIVAASTALLPFCAPPTKYSTQPGWGISSRNRFCIAMALWGALGSVLDSFLGGWLQESVVDTRTGRIVEGEGGKKVLVSKTGPSSLHYKKDAEIKSSLLHGEGKDSLPAQPLDGKPSGREKPSRRVESGTLGLLDNNEVNFIMALTMSLGAMGIAGWFWDVPLSSIFST